MRKVLALALAASLMAGTAWAQSGGGGSGSGGGGGAGGGRSAGAGSAGSGGSSAVGGSGGFGGGSSAAGGASGVGSGSTPGIGSSPSGSFGPSRSDTPLPGVSGIESLGTGTGSGRGNERTLGSQSGPLDAPRGLTPSTRCPPGQSASVNSGCLSSADPSSRRTLPSDMSR
jgi:hypothetical protein